MVDTNIIRDHYSGMLDSQLIDVAVNDGVELMPGAFELLKEEFAKRNLDPSYIQSAEATRVLSPQQDIRTLENSFSPEKLTLIWKYVLQEKDQNTPYYEILKGLGDRGLNEFHARSILSGLEQKLKTLIETNEAKVLGGGALFVIGILVAFWSYTSFIAPGTTYYLAWAAILFGGLRFFTAIVEKGKYRRILKNLHAPEIINIDEDELTGQL